MGLTGVLGRLLFATIFLSSAINKLRTLGADGGQTLAYAGPKLDAFKAHVASLSGVSLDALPIKNRDLLYVACAMEGVGASLFVLGSRLGAQLLLVFVAAVSVVMHAFWDLDPASPEAVLEMTHFFKNLSLAGALISWLAQRSALERMASTKKLKAL